MTQEEVLYVGTILIHAAVCTMLVLFFGLMARDARRNGLSTRYKIFSGLTFFWIGSFWILIWGLTLIK